MEDNWEDNWENDWENEKIPDLLTSLKNKERELKLLEERKLVEDSDMALSEELFNGEKETNNEYKKVESITTVKLIKKEKSKDLQEKKRNELQEKQKQQAQKEKQRKQQEKKLRELYGEAELDEYDEKYGYIEEQY
jgi:cbb3-type cytochrome oxidase cytochrome c subunit